MPELANGASTPLDPEAARQKSAQACWPQLKQLQKLRRLAQDELRQCRLHDYHTHCKEAEEARRQIQSPASPCAQLKEVDPKGIPELACNVVNVPDSCSRD